MIPPDPVQLSMDTSGGSGFRDLPVSPAHPLRTKWPMGLLSILLPEA